MYPDQLNMDLGLDNDSCNVQNNLPEMTTAMISEDNWSHQARTISTVF
jgi:hypothetical protein